jgi:hypothetical protein
MNNLESGAEYTKMKTRTHYDAFTISTSDILFMNMAKVILGSKILSAVVNLNADPF